MSNFYYNETKIIKGDTLITTKDHIIFDISETQDVSLAILDRKLQNKRFNRLRKLLASYNGEVSDVEALRAFLPDEFKRYADDYDKLEAEMASMYEIVKKYQFSDIRPAPQCYGCLYDRPGQRDHMEHGGCLHESSECLKCNSQT